MKEENAPGRGGREGWWGKSGPGRESKGARAGMSIGGGESMGGRTGWEAETMSVCGHQHRGRERRGEKRRGGAETARDDDGGQD